MHKYEIIMMPLSQYDILNITKYVTFSFDSPESVLKRIRALQNSLSSLLYKPYLNRVEQDKFLSAYEIRSYHYKKLKIYYYVSKLEQTIYILRILHRNALKIPNIKHVSCIN